MVQWHINCTKSNAGTGITKYNPQQLRSSSRCQPSVRDTRHFHTTNTGQEHRDQLRQDMTSFLSSSLVQQAQGLLRTCHTTVLDRSTIQAFFKLTNPKSGKEDPSETLKPPVLWKRLDL